MRMTVPVYRDIDGIFFHKKIEDYFCRTGVIGEVSYNQTRPPQDNTVLIDWQVQSGTIPISMPDAANPYGIKPCGRLKIESRGVDDENQLIRQLMVILDERAIIFPDNEIKAIREKFERNRPLAVTFEEHDYWKSLWNSLRSLERAIYELSKLNQFIHMWRSFNSLYSYIYKRDTGKDPKNTDEQKMFNHFLGCGKFVTKRDCKLLVDLFLAKYDLCFLYELKIDTMRLTKEGWEELVEKGVVQPIEGETKEKLKDKKIWMFEGVDWRDFLTFREGLKFFECFQKGNYPAALREVVAFVYEVNRNNIFHGREPFFEDDEIALFQASIEMLYRLLLISIPTIFQQYVE